MSVIDNVTNNVKVELKEITKKFGDFVANDKISIKFIKGEVHALLGENGAGKSTLMNILYGLYTPTDGKIFLDGQEVNIKSPKDSIELGIGMVHQHFMLVDVLTVTENVMLGSETIKHMGILDVEASRRKLIELSEEYGLEVNPDAYVKDLSVGMQQRIEILKALYRGAEVLILDEPTAVLTPQEILSLERIIRNLTAQGKTIVIITHKLKEILSMADRCTVIRRGRCIGIVDVQRTDEQMLASMMVGREVTFKVDKGEYQPGKCSFEIDNLVVEGVSGIHAVDGFSLKAYEGEIIGIAGIDGNGQTELIESLIGIRNRKSGRVLLDGIDISTLEIEKRNQLGFSLIPEDRHKHGLVLDLPVYENFVLNKYREPSYSTRGFLNFENIKSHSREMIERFDIRLNEISDRASVLSGGNQQKIIIAREVSRGPKVLVAAQPTRGLDVGAIEFVHKELVKQRDEGKTVILISYELDEIMSLADRIAVMYEGKIVGVFKSGTLDEMSIGLMMSGGRYDETSNKHLSS